MEFKRIKYTDVKEGMFIFISSDRFPYDIKSMDYRGFHVCRKLNDNNNGTVIVNTRVYIFNCFKPATEKPHNVSTLGPNVSIVIHDYDHVFAIDPDEAFEFIEKINKLYSIFSVSIKNSYTQLMDSLNRV